MKRILILVTLLIAVSTMTFAQDRTAEINMGGSYIDIPVSDADTINASQTEYIIQIAAAQNYPTTQDLEVSMTGEAVSNIDVLLQGSKFGTTWTDIGVAQNYSGGDQTVSVNNSTVNRYRIYRVVFTWTSGSATVTSAKFKLYYE